MDSIVISAASLNALAQTAIWETSCGRWLPCDMSVEHIEGTLSYIKDKSHFHTLNLDIWTQIFKYELDLRERAKKDLVRLKEYEVLKKKAEELQSSLKDIESELNDFEF